MITMQNVRKTYGNFTFEISMELPEGQILGLIGKNGAGKSTTISILCGQLSKDAGEVRINGADQTHAGQDTRYLLGVVFQDSVLDKPLTVRENLKSGQHYMELQVKLLKTDCRS